jgi:hypothetical protein
VTEDLKGVAARLKASGYTIAGLAVDGLTHDLQEQGLVPKRLEAPTAEEPDRADPPLKPAKTFRSYGELEACDE